MITVRIKTATDADFIDRTDQLNDVSLELGITKEASTASLSIIYIEGKYRPQGEDEVEIYDGEDRIFSGFVVGFRQKLAVGGLVAYECQLKDYIHRLDRILINVSYEDKRADEIVSDVVDRAVGELITTSSVEIDNSASIKSITFNNVSPSEAISKVAEILGKEWYIDADKDIHFFSKLQVDAPWPVTETNGKMESQTLVVNKDYTQIRNSILITGGEEKSTTRTTDRLQGDGTTTSFPLTKKFSDLVVTVDGVPVSVGTANLHSFDNFDCLYDFSLNTLSFAYDNPPASGVEILVDGFYYFPIAVRFRETVSVGIFGERQFYIEDRSLRSRTDAIARAQAEVSSYALALNEGGFTTYESGLRPGQKLTVSAPTMNVQEDFVIQRVSGRYNEGKMEWSVDLVSLKTFELIDLLAEIIRGRRSGQEGEETVVGAAERYNRRLRVGREWAIYYNNPPVWVVGPYHPTGLADRKRVGFTDRGTRLG